MQQQKNMTPKLSLVVAVYNVQAFLASCIDSVLSQNGVEQTELILVDDGSTDESADIARRYAEQNPARVRFYQKPNGGASSARNMGITKAQGEYIQFLDSDDWLEPGALGKILEALKTDPDVLLINLNRYRDGKKEGSTGWNPETLQEGKERFLSRLVSRHPMYSLVVGPIVRRGFLRENELSFLEGVIHEDMEWVPKLLVNAQKLAILAEPVYGYRLGREGSVMNANTCRRHTESLMQVSRTLMGLSQGRPRTEREFLTRNAGLCLFMAMGYAFEEDKAAAAALEKEIKADLLLRPALRRLPKKYTLCVVLGGGLAGGIARYRKKMQA